MSAPGLGITRSGSGPALVLLHPLGADRRVWAPVSALLARERELDGLERIPVPVTLAWPEHDRMVARPRRLPPGVRFVVLRGCGHLPMWDDPDQVAAVLAAPLLV